MAMTLVSERYPRFAAQEIVIVPRVVRLRLECWRSFLAAILKRYRPELHYSAVWVQSGGQSKGRSGLADAPMPCRAPATAGVADLVLLLPQRKTNQVAEGRISRTGPLGG